MHDLMHASRVPTKRTDACIKGHIKGTDRVHRGTDQRTDACIKGRIEGTDRVNRCVHQRTDACISAPMQRESGRTPLHDLIHASRVPTSAPMRARSDTRIEGTDQRTDACIKGRIEGTDQRTDACIKGCIEGTDRVNGCVHQRVHRGHRPAPTGALMRASKGASRAPTT
jgi:hypothetical protein